MTLQEFINKYNGKGLDWDGYYGDQCMDQMHYYIVEVLGLSGNLFAAPTAYEAYKNANDARFEKIANSPTNVPQNGDIVFWNTTVGTAGHVAVFVSGDENKFTSFDQNWPTGSLCHLQPHDYRGVAGWLRFKGGGSVTSYKGYDLDNKESMKVAVDILVRVQQGEFVDKSKYDADLKAAKEANAGNSADTDLLNKTKSILKELVK